MLFATLLYPIDPSKKKNTTIKQHHTQCNEYVWVSVNHYNTAHIHCNSACPKSVYPGFQTILDIKQRMQSFFFFFCHGSKDSKITLQNSCTGKSLLILELNPKPC